MCDHYFALMNSTRIALEGREREREIIPIRLEYLFASELNSQLPVFWRSLLFSSSSATSSFLAILFLYFCHHKGLLNRIVGQFQMPTVNLIIKLHVKSVSFSSHSKEFHALLQDEISLSRGTR